MTPIESRRLVLGLVVVGAVLVGVARAADADKPVRARLVIGAGVVLVVLTMLSEVAPRLAVSMAALVAVSSLFTAAPAIRTLTNRITT